jgi:hypothetical protein
MGANLNRGRRRGQGTWLRRMRVAEAPLAASADVAGKLLPSNLVVIWAMRRNLVIETLRAHADAIRARGVTALYLYGSTARDDAGDKSDVDLFADVDYQRFGFIPFMDLRDLPRGTARLQSGLHYAQRSPSRPAGPDQTMGHKGLW